MPFCICRSCREENALILRTQMSSIDSKEGLATGEPLCRRITQKQAVELIYSCSFEGDKAPRVGFKELLAVGRHSSIGLLVRSIDYGSCEFMGFPGNFVRDLNTMSALDFIRNVDGGHCRLGAQEFDDFVGYEGFVCRGIRDAMNSNTFVGSCEFFDLPEASSDGICA